MKRILTILICMLAAAVIIAATSLRSFASGDRIVARGINVNANRLFDIKVGVKSSKALSAGTFKLRYDVSKYEFRSLKTEAVSCEAKASDNNGIVRIVFLCENGLRLDNTPLLFSVKFKKLNEESGSVKISASDFVDENVKSFSPPSGIKCTITSPKGSYTESLVTKRSGKRTFGSGYKYASSQRKTKSSGTVSSGSVDDGEEIETFYEPYTAAKRGIAPEFIYASIAFVAAVIVIVYAYQRKKNKF